MEPHIAVSKSKHPIGAMGRGAVACLVASAYSVCTHKGAKHSTSVKRAPHRGNGVGHGGVFGGVCVLPAHTHKEATHSTSVKRAPHRGDAMVAVVTHICTSFRNLQSIEHNIATLDVDDRPSILAVEDDLPCILRLNGDVLVD